MESKRDNESMQAFKARIKQETRKVQYFYFSHTKLFIKPYFTLFILVTKSIADVSRGSAEDDSYRTETQTPLEGAQFEEEEQRKGHRRKRSN